MLQHTRLTRRSAALDDERTLAPWQSVGTTAFRSSRASAATLRKFHNVEKEIQVNYDDLKQLSHGSFGEKRNVCLEARVDDEREIVRICEEPAKKDSCALNTALYNEQCKGRMVRDDRALLYFPELSSVAEDWPLFITVETRIVGRELLDIVESCTMPLGPQRMTYMTNLFLQILDGLSFLHGRGFTHNDISPDNVLVEDEHVRIKIIDFDSAVNVYDEGNPYRFVDDDGTALHDWYGMRLLQKEPYRAFECWKAYELLSMNNERKVFVDLKAGDVFASMVLFVEMLTGDPPPVQEFDGVKELAGIYATAGWNIDRGELSEAFVESLTMFYVASSESLDPYGDSAQNVKDLLDDIMTEPKKPAINYLPNGEEITVVRVERKSVHDILDLPWSGR